MFARCGFSLSLSIKICKVLRSYHKFLEKDFATYLLLGSFSSSSSTFPGSPKALCPKPLERYVFESWTSVGRPALPPGEPSFSHAPTLASTWESPRAPKRVILLLPVTQETCALVYDGELMILIIGCMELALKLDKTQRYAVSSQGGMRRKGLVTSVTVGTQPFPSPGGCRAALWNPQSLGVWLAGTPLWLPLLYLAPRWGRRHHTDVQEQIISPFPSG